MLKICMILPKGLPVPSVKGGAIETLITEISKQNEIIKKIDLTIFSIYDTNAAIEAKKYKHTKFCYVKNNLMYKLFAIKVRIKNLFNKNLNTYNEVILSKIKKKDFDYIIVEDGAYSSFLNYLKYFDKDKMILHFHHCGHSDKLTNATYNTFFGVSEYVTEKFKKNSKIKNHFVVKNGINLNSFKKEVLFDEKKELRNQLGISDDDFVVLYCGRLVKEKGVLELITAINNIKNKKIKLLIVGSVNFGNIKTSEYLLTLQKNVDNSKGRIVTTGFIKNEEVYKYFKISDIAVFPTLIEEAALLVNIEAMACGIPTIITNSGGSVEYSTDETLIISKDNIIKNIENSIMYLYKNDEKRKKMIDEGIKKSKLYSSENMYWDFIKAIERIR